VHTSAAKLRGHRVANVMQPDGRGIPARWASRLNARVKASGVRGQAISAIAYHRKRIAPLVQWVTPCGAERRTWLELFCRRIRFRAKGGS
jgi:hypothetical protein